MTRRKRYNRVIPFEAEQPRVDSDIMKTRAGGKTLHNKTVEVTSSAL